MNKTYKARVEISLIVEMDVEAEHEDNAAAIAEEIVEENIPEDMGYCGYSVVNYGVRCIEAEEADDE